MNSLAVARAIHVASIVLWIGGVGFVTTALLPWARRHDDPASALALFNRLERRFAWQARLTTATAGASGFYMVDRMDLWGAFGSPDRWWLAAMVAVWAIFTAVLFVAEPLFLARWFERRAAADPRGALALLQRLHGVLAVLSLATILGAVAGSHGLMLFG